jgi:hypothetical protein
MIDKLTPKYLNLEDDERLVKAVEMTNAINVRLSSEQDGDGNIVKNAYGNDDVPFKTGSALPAGDNEVIGAVENSESGEIFYFVWNSNDDHTIYRYSTSSDEVQIVYRDSVLAFSKFYHVRASIVRNLVGETLLYFTDANTPPKKINVTRAILGLYPASFTSGTDAEKLANIAIAKQPPMTPPTFVFTTNPALKENNLYESAFQFAAQYVYQDGERSAISQYSELAVAQNQFFDGIIDEEQKLANNTLSISVPTSVADVKEIVVLARNGNAGAFYEIGTLVNSPSVATQTISFDNTKLYAPVSQDQVNKIYDNVPQTAEALDIAGNRLMLGGYTEGYENIRTDVAVLPNYFPQPGEYEIAVTYPSEPFVSDWFNKSKEFDIDISNIPSVVSVDSILNLSFALDFGRITLNVDGYYLQWVQKDKATQTDNDYAGLVAASQSGSNNPFDFGVNVKSSPFSISEYVQVQAGTTKSEILDIIVSKIEGNYNVVLDSDVTDFTYATRIESVKELQASVNSKPDKWMFFAGSGQLSVSAADTTQSTYIRFKINVDSAAVSAKLGYNFNVGSILNSITGAFPITTMIRSLFTRGKSIDEAYPATNLLFNQIEFVDVPSVIYQGDNEPRTLYTDVDINNGQLEPEGPLSGIYRSAFLWNEDDQENGVSFDASLLTRGEIDANQSFKAGAAHSFGIVYYDQFNRNGGVQTVPDMYVNWFDNRFVENSLYGRTDSVLRVKHNAPLWAVKWSPVYAKTNNVTQKFQYSVTSAFTATNLQAKPFAGVSSFEDITYVSIRSLEGKSDSYRESFGANLEYVFQKGDRLHIVQFGYLQRTTIDVEVLGLFDFTDDIDSNPILDLTSDEATFNTTGKFIAVRSTDETGWDNYSIITGEDNWKDECVIEVYRTNKPTEQQIFYEIGETFNVVNGVHQGQRTTISQFSVEVVDADDLNNLVVHSNIIAYKGDTLTDGSGRTLQVGNVYPQVNGPYNYVFYAQTVSGSFTDTTYTLNITNSSDAVVQLSQGDVYYRPRLLKVGDKAYANNYKFFFIEDYSVSDFFDSKSVSVGRPHAVQPDAQTVFRSASVTYSEPFVIDSKYLGLSSFNLSLANFYDFEYLHGTIKQLVGDDDRVYIIQERKAGWAPVGRNIIESTDGVQSLALSRNVIGVPNYYLGDYGINDNPESLATDRGRIYFADIRSGKVVRISRDGIALISEQLMDAFFKENFRYIATNASRQKVVGGVDRESDQYIISTDFISNAVISVESIDPEAASYSYTAQTNADGDAVVVDLEFDDDDLFTFSTEIREFQVLCDEFDDSLNAIVYLDKIIDGQPAYVGEEFIGMSGVIYGVATNSSYDFFVTIALDLATGEFYFTNDCGDYSGTIGSPSNLVNDFTAAYDVEDNAWMTLYSFRPEAVASIDDTLFTFKGGVMYKHSSDVPRARYYGEPTSYAEVEVVSNNNPSMVKSYESISLEGNSAWTAEFTNTDQSTSLLVTDFSERERNYYAYIPRDSSANTGTSTITALSGSSEVFVIGEVASTSGATITFSTPVGDVPFPIGAQLYKVSSGNLVILNLTVTAISGDKQITASGTVTGLVAGDTIVAIGNGAIEGDQMRDYYIKTKLTTDSADNVELYAVNLVYAKSNLHNELGQ